MRNPKAYCFSDKTRVYPEFTPALQGTRQLK
jgi:hypothetical protein